MVSGALDTRRIQRARSERLCAGASLGASGAEGIDWYASALLSPSMLESDGATVTLGPDDSEELVLALGSIYSTRRGVPRCGGGDGTRAAFLGLPRLCASARPSSPMDHGDMGRSR